MESLGRSGPVRCALALLAFGLAAPAGAQMVEIPLMSRNTAEGRAAREAAYQRDLPAVRPFLAALRTGAASPGRIISYSWRPLGEAPLAIDRARLAELLAPCTFLGEGMELVLRSHTRFRAGPSSEDYVGVGVNWTCSGPAAAAPALYGSFRFRDGLLAEVELSAEPATVTH